MKRFRLLLAAFVAMIGLSAQAQSWVAPTITGEDPVSGGQYKIKNVGAGTFLDMGKAWFGWSTTAILSANGINFTMNADGNNWKFIRTGTQGVFTSGNGITGDAMHVDNTANTYGITKLANGNYHIHDANGNETSPCWGHNSSITGNNTTISNGVVAHADATAEGWMCEWQFIPATNELYNARVALYEELLKAYAEGADYSAASDVYENSSNASEVTAATAALHQTRYNHALAVASNEDPREITEWVLTNADISEGNQLQMPPGWETNYVSGQQATNIGCQHNSDYTNEAVTLHYFIEAWKPGATLGDGYLRQTVQNLPEGKFVLEADAIATWQNDDTRTITGAQLYITADGVTYKTDMSTKNGKPQHFSTEFLNTGEGDVIFGLRTVSANCNWLCADNFKVTFYGIDLSPYATLLAQAVAEAQAVEGTVPAGVYNALAAVVTDKNKAWETSKEYTTAIAAIQNATDNAKAIQNAYAKYNALKAAALAIAENTNTVDADASANAASDGAAIEAAIVQLRAAFLAELPNLPVLAEGIDVTSVMVENASVRQGVEGWTISDVVRMDEYGTGPTTNYEETEFYHSNFRIYQTLALTPGTWEFGVTGFHRAGNHNTHFYAGEDRILIPGVESSVVNSMAEAQTYFNNGNGKVALKFLVETAADIEIGINNQDTETDRWTIFRDFTLKYYGAPDYTVYKNQWSQAVTDAEDALTTYADYDSFTATEKSTLEGAKANAPAVDEKKAGYITKINALTDATAAYIALSKKYESAKTAIARANAIKEAHNFASAEAITTFTNAINAFSDKYDDLTLTEEEAVAAATNLGSLVTGHRAGANTAASNYLENGFGLNDFDADLCVNTWSTEGDTDGSGFSVPFYEYWTEDANSLGEQTWSGTLTGLEKGLYEVSAWVRVRAKNEVTAGDATGITMDVNGGGEGDYAAVDVTEGAQIGESQFQIQTYTAQNLVKDGNLTLNFNIAAENNISWLSFKNVKYTKVRDLTPEEAFTPATAEDYQALAEAIAAKKIGFDEGEYAPYNNIEAIAALKAAQAIDPEASNSQEDVQAATQAISDATWTVNETEVNAIWDASFQHDYSGQEGNVNPIGWQRVKDAAADGWNVRYMGGANAGLAATSSGKALFTKNSAFYGYADGFTMPMKANTYYKVSFIYGGWGDCKKDGYVTMLAPDGSDIELSASDLPLDATDADSNKDSWKSFEAIFQTGEAGDYVLGLRKKNESVQSQYVYGDFCIMRATAADFKVALQQAIDDAQAEKAKYIVGEDLFMYPESEMAPLTNAIATATDALNDGEATVESIIAARETLLTAVENFAPAANQPDAEKAYTFQLRLDGETPLYMNLTESGITIAETATALKFVVADVAGQFYLATDAGEPLYVGLAGNNEWSMSTAAEKKAAWTFSALGDNAYRINNLTTAGRFVGTNAADKAAGSYCYADKLTSNGNVDWIITEYNPIPTGVAGIKTDGRKSVIYDLSGRKVEKMVKGVYIINGKKVSIK